MAGKTGGQVIGNNLKKLKEKQEKLAKEEIVEGEIVASDSNAGNMREITESSTSVEVFKPRAKQALWLDTALASMTDNVSKIARESGIDPKTWYNWQKEPGFIDWYLTEWDKRIKIYRPNLDAIGIRKASKEHKYWRDMQKIMGALQENGSMVQNNINFGVDFIKND